MKIFGMTGGIGMGKSTAGELLRRRGIAVIDTDVLAHEAVEPGQPALAEIISHFGSAVVHSDGRLDREKMAQIVFAQPQARKELEEILHPRIRAAWQAQVATWAKEGRTLCVVTIPLLFETEASALFAATVCVACSSSSQWARLRHRGWDSNQIRRRIAAQLPVHKKIAAADFLIWTDTPLDVHEAQLERVFRV